MKPKNLSILFLLVATCAPSFAAALDWPEFRGPTGQGISLAKNVPIHWSATSNVVWKTAVPAGWSSPVISEGRIYLTGAVETNGISLRALCVDANTSQIVWDVGVLHTPTVGEKHKKNGAASPTPIVRDGKLYVHFGHLGAAALDLTGKVLWTQTGLKYPPVHGNGGSAALVGDNLIFCCDASSDPFLVALDARTGKVRWKTPRNSPAQRTFSFATPLLINNNGAEQLITPASGFIGAYDPKTGTELWRVLYPEGYSLVPRPVFAHGLIFFSTGFDHPITYAINPAGARGDVTEKAVVWTQAKGAPTTPSPIVAGDELYIVSDSGIATCFDAKTGTVHWTERLGGGFSASPILAEGRLYFQNEEGMGYVVAASKQFQILAKNDLGDRTLASPAAIDNALILRSAGYLWRVGK